jgi:hypothetical protein
VSSAILYFAIVAIWAGVLMPKWLRPSRSHRHRADGDQPAEAIAEFAQPAPDSMLEERQPGRSDQSRDDGARDDGARDDGARDDGARDDRIRDDRSRDDRSRDDRSRDDRSRDDRDETPGERREADSPEAERPAAWSPEEAAERQVNILRARRRMLGTLIVLTAGAFAIAVTHVAAWWVIIPPGVLLGGFLLLLREASRSDAKRARREAELATRRRRMERESQAVPAAPAETGYDEIAGAAEVVVETEVTAKIIDISARVTDQLYDQYTDAAERAVGD